MQGLLCQTSLDFNSSSPVSSYVTLGKLLNWFELQFSHLLNEINAHRLDKVVVKTEDNICEGPTKDLVYSIYLNLFNSYLLNVFCVCPVGFMM